MSDTAIEWLFAALGAVMLLAAGWALLALLVDGRALTRRLPPGW